VSSFAERYCGVQFEYASVSERYDGDGTNLLILDNRPVNSVSRVAIEPTDVLLVTNTSDTATEAYASISSTVLTLTLITGGSTTTNSLTLASYSTLDLLAAAINALSANGWSATVTTGYGSFSPSDLVVTEAMYCLDSSAYFPIFGDSENDYIIYPEKGWIVLEYGYFTAGKRNVLVEYTYGYSTIPGALKEAILRLVSLVYHRSSVDPTLSSEKLGDHSWSRTTSSEDDLQKAMQEELAMYRRFDIVTI
jgi:hypothetical protein